MTVVQAVTPGHAVLDVGCDHAYAAIWLVRNGISPCAVASDVRPGPLLAAEANIKAEGLAGQIRTVLADGVPADYREYTGQQAVTLILAGMGGRLMSAIIGRAAAEGILPEEIVSSPQRDPDVLRGCLAGHGFRITDEMILREDGKTYTVIRSSADGQPVPELSPAEALYGPVLLSAGNELLLEELQKKKALIMQIRRSVSRETEKGSKRIQELDRETAIITEAIQRLEAVHGAKS